MKENLSQNQATLKSYEIKLIFNYNDLIEYTTGKYESLSEENQESVSNAIILQRARLERCFEKLKVKLHIGEDIFDLIIGTTPITRRRRVKDRTGLRRFINGRYRRRS